jgi:transglutaminase-like putative cysteine protease
MMHAMKRSVSAHIAVRIDSPVTMVFAASVAEGITKEVETIDFRYGDSSITPVEISDLHGTRLHQFTVGAGTLTMDYWATVTGDAVPAAITAIDRITYLKPSRYCESDILLPTAVSEFAGLKGRALLDAVSSWVGDKLSYVPGSSLPTDGAVRTLLARQGVCRDYAHLVVALLRALDVPARLVAVYAPGLDPMDFHAVAEAFVDGQWRVVDGTLLAPRSSLLRIATGRDAADTAFLDSFGGAFTFNDATVTAVVEGNLPSDDPRTLVTLG